MTRFLGMLFALAILTVSAAPQAFALCDVNGCRTLVKRITVTSSAEIAYIEVHPDNLGANLPAAPNDLDCDLVNGHSFILDGSSTGQNHPNYEELHGILTGALYSGFEVYMRLDTAYTDCTIHSAWSVLP